MVSQVSYWAGMYLTAAFDDRARLEEEAEPWLDEEDEEDFASVTDEAVGG